MKKIFEYFLLVGSLFFMFILSSCAGGTEGCPTMSLPFEENTVTKVNIDYLKILVMKCVAISLVI